MLADLDFATAYLHDILIKSKNREDHAKHVTEVFKKIKQIGFKLSMEKCKFFSQKSNIWDENGRTPDPNRADAIKYIPAPTNVVALQ